jgi:hypothetical protein
MVPNFSTQEILQTKINDLDLSVREVIFSTHSRTNVVLPRFNEFIDILSKLGFSFYLNEIDLLSVNNEILTLSKSFHINDEDNEKKFEFRNVDDVEKFWEEFKNYCIGSQGSENFLLGTKDEKKLSKFKQDLFEKVPDLKNRWNEMANISNQNVL